MGVVLGCKDLFLQLSSEAGGGGFAGLKWMDGWIGGGGGLISLSFAYRQSPHHHRLSS